MDVLPLAVTAMPDAGLLRLHGARHTAAIDVLGETDVGDAGRLVADQVDVGVEQDGVDGLLGLGQSCRGQEHGCNNDLILRESTCFDQTQNKGIKNI